MLDFIFVMICIAVGTLVYKIVSLFVDVLVEYVSTTKWFIRWNNKFVSKRNQNSIEVQTKDK